MLAARGDLALCCYCPVVWRKGARGVRRQCCDMAAGRGVYATQMLWYGGRALGACGANAGVWRYGAGCVRRKCCGMAAGRGVRRVSEAQSSAWGVFGGEMLSARCGVHRAV